MRSKVVTKKMERIGTVYDIFGPEKTPYVSVRPDRGAKNIRSLINERVYVA